MSTKELVARLASALGPEGACFEDPRVLRRGTRNLVLRARWHRPGRPARSVVVKALGAEQPGLGRNDQAALGLLGELEVEGLAPELLGSTEEPPAFVMEDLDHAGRGATLEARLRGPDPGVVLEALRGLAEASARLHRRTRGLEEAWRRAHARVPGAATHRVDAEARAWRSQAGAVEAWAERLGVSSAPELGRALDQVASRVAEPGAEACLTHGDPAPTNALALEGRVALVDFEYAAFRHPLYDLTAWSALCPLPASALEAMVRAYREAAGELADFEGAWAHQHAYRGVALLSWLPPELLERERPWVDEWGARAALVVTCGRLAEACRGMPGLGPLEATAARLHEALVARWPALGPEPLPPWPALADGRVREPAPS